MVAKLDQDAAWPGEHVPMASGNEAVADATPEVTAVQEGVQRTGNNLDTAVGTHASNDAPRRKSEEDV